jgi:very-short-patch-repair endonuclease
MSQMQSLFKKIPQVVTAITQSEVHPSSWRLSFLHGRDTTQLSVSIACARRSAQPPSPLTPLQTSWRGKGRTSLAGDVSRRRRKIKFSKELRQRSTYTEQIAWNMLRSGRCLGLKFRRQYGISGFIIDFYCYEHRLAIEIDGSSHIGREEYDAMRQRKLEDEGISFIRITADEMESNPESLINRIRAVVDATQASPHSPLQLAWRGGGGEACAHIEQTKLSSSQTSSASADEAKLGRHSP